MAFSPVRQRLQVDGLGFRNCSTSHHDVAALCQIDPNTNRSYIVHIHQGVAGGYVNLVARLKPENPFILRISLQFLSLYIISVRSGKTYLSTLTEYQVGGLPPVRRDPEKMFLQFPSL